MIHRKYISFSQACDYSAHEIALLRDRSLYKEAFDKAMQGMMTWKADINNGVTYNKTEWVSRYCDYNWRSDYEKHPHFIFYDFFRAGLLNKYQRIINGID